MAYVVQQQGSNRARAIAVVAAVHLVLGYGFVVGLAPDLIDNPGTIFEGWNVPADPPPPPIVPAPPPTLDKVVEPSIRPLTAPTPTVRPPLSDSVRVPLTPADPAPVPLRPLDGLRDLDPAPVPVAKALPKAPLPPAKPAPSQSVKRAAISSIGFGDADYPDAALRAGESGVTQVRVTISASGRASDCTVTRSSGSTSLDRAACRLVESRSRFTPAKDTAGAKVAQTLDLPITWRLPR